MAKSIDTDWFKDQIKEKNLSQSALARRLDIDKSALSRTLSGHRIMKMEEAQQIAQFLRVPVSEVMAHAGVSVDLDGMPTQIMLAAIIEDKGMITRLTEPRPLPQGLIERAQSAIAKTGNGRIIAAQIRASTGPLLVWDDAVVLFRPTEIMEPLAIGALAVYRCRDNNQQGVAKVLRARKTGEATLQMVSGEIVEMVLETASPIIAVLP